MNEGVVDAGVAAKAAEKSADAATKGARAAELNATVLIDAERAHIYAIIDSSSISEIRARMLVSKPFDLKQPLKADVQYHLINYGKSPAIITNVLHGIIIGDRIKKREFMSAWDNLMQTREFDEWGEAMEILEVGKGSYQKEASMDPKMSLREASSIVDEKSPKAFFFYGLAFFSDSFGRRYTVQWEYMYTSQGWQLMAHKERKEA